MFPLVRSSLLTFRTAEARIGPVLTVTGREPRKSVAGRNEEGDGCGWSWGEGAPRI